MLTKYAVIDAALIGDNEIIPALPGKRIAVTSYALVGAAAVDATWKSGTTAISGPMAIGSAGAELHPTPAVAHSTRSMCWSPSPVRHWY